MNFNKAGSEFEANSIYKLSIPSVIFADASWYGSLRGGVNFGGGKDAYLRDGASRWGIKGSNELSDGLSAVYRFEHKISTSNASQAAGRLAYVGLSGGFGNVSLGQIWNAAFNHVGGITDPSWHNGDAHMSYRHGSALSYAVSAGAVSLQLDAIMDSGTDTGDAVDKIEFGMSFDLGDIGKVGLAYVDKKDYMKPVADKFMPGTPTKVTVVPGTPGTAATAPTVSVEDGMANVPTMVEEVDNVVDAKLTFNIDANGDLMLATVDGVTYPTDEEEQAKLKVMYDDGEVKYSTYLDVTAEGVSQGTISAKSDDTTKREVERVSFVANVANSAAISFAGLNMLADDATSGTGFKMIGDVYVHSACLNTDYDGIDTATNENCGNTRQVFKVSYTQAVAGVDIDGNPNPRQNKGSFQSAATNIDITADGTKVNGTTFNIEPGTAGTPTVVTVVDGMDGTASTPPDVMVTPGTVGDFVKQPDEHIVGHRASYLATEVNLGAVSAHLGYLQKQKNGADAKTKVTHYGVSGSIGDTGMGFVVQARKEDNADGTSANPWFVTLNKSLGDGASAYFEHGNADDGESGNTTIGLKVDF